MYNVDSEGNKFSSAIQASNFHNIGETTVRRLVKITKMVGIFYLNKVLNKGKQNGYNTQNSVR
jgi:hypothetical protein